MAQNELFVVKHGDKFAVLRPKQDAPVATR
jgi:hypothetical protein